MGFVAIILDDAAIVKVSLNQRIENILQYYIVPWTKCLTRFNAPIAEAIFFISSLMCTFQGRFWSICTPTVFVREGLAIDF